MLESHLFDECWKIIKKLDKWRYTGAIELKARVLWEEKKTAEAMEVLERGVQQYPKLWILWSYLGQFRSDSGHYDLAVEAFLNAGQGSKRNQDIATFNIAVVQVRAEQPEKAVELLEQLPLEPGFVMGIWGKTTLHSLQLEAGEVEKSLATIREASEYILSHWRRDQFDHSFAATFALRALAELAEGNPDEVEKFRQLGVSCDQYDPMVAKLNRRLAGVKLENGRLYYVIVSGQTRESPVAPGKVKDYATFYWVQVDSEDEILPYIIASESTSGFNLQITECTDQDEPNDEWAGVVSGGKERWVTQ